MAAGEDGKVGRAVVVDPGGIVDAAVVRIMKQKRILPLPALVQEVAQQVSATFAADARMVKERIEQLMEREYLERCKEEPGTLVYCP
jgi:cullin 3